MTQKQSIVLNFIIIVNLLTYSAAANCQKIDFSNFKGSYLSELPTGKVPEVFILSSVIEGANYHSHPAFSADGRELFWSVYVQKSEHYNEGNLFYHMKEVDGKWAQPVFSEDSKIYDDGSPFFSLSGERVYFFSDRPNPMSDSTWRIQMDFDIWYLEKEGDNWSEPKWLSTLPNSTDNWEFDVCQIKDGSMYYTRNNIEGIKTKFGIVKSTFIDGAFTTPKVLGKQFNDGNRNWSPYVDPDETYMIFSSNRGDPEAGNKGCDLYISYRKKNGEWTDPINLGEDINSKETIERFPYVSPNGRYFFFIRGYGDIYWMHASFIEELRPK